LVDSSSDSRAGSDARRDWCLAAAVVALAAALYLLRLGERALWSEELRWAEIPREMLLRGDFTYPTINGQGYYDKPLGSYWLVLAAARLTGSVDELAARLPCAVAALLGVVLLISLARRLYDGRTAALAGLVLTTSFSYVFFARHATADMENLTGILAAVVLWQRHDGRTGGKWVIALWLLMAVTSLTKGLLGFALPLLIFAVHSCLDGPFPRRVRSLVERNPWLFNRWSWVAIPLGVVVFLAPFALSANRGGSGEGLALVYRENIQRFFHPHNHRGPVYLYGYVVFALMVPWSVFLPAALVQAHHSCRHGAQQAREDRFALVYFWTTFVFFTLSASRRSYYLLPILPAGATLTARLLTTPRESLAPAARRLLGAGFGVLLAAVVLAGCALLPPGWLTALPWTELPPLPGPWLLGTHWLLCVATAAFALRDFRPGRVALAAGAAAVASMTYLYLVALPAAEAYRDEKGFALRVKAALGPDAARLGMFRTREPVFYLAQTESIQEFSESDSLRRAVSEGRVRWLIVRRRHLEEIPLPYTVADAEAIFAWEGEGTRASKLLLLRLGEAVPRPGGEP